ncbi:MAG: hypothetical protein QF473_13120 [Planctomycetota bacterium]|nr:hypothetical protein [Planctomycetota bacterium]
MTLWIAGCVSNETREGKTQRQKHSFTIHKSSESCTIDGRLDERFWISSEPLDGFRVDANPKLIPADKTTVRVAFDDDVLFVAFVCIEKRMQELKAAIETRRTKVEPGAVQRPQEAWPGDYCELQIFSRPETPYYSPFMQRLDYKNANRKARTQRRFIVSADGHRREANIYKVGAHTAYMADEKWDGDWMGAVAYQADRFVVEMSIPWSQIGGMPQPGHTFRLGFIRHRKASVEELSRFNWYSGENFQVESFDPASFEQEHPIMFAPVTWEKDRAILTRYIETSDPWSVKRKRPEYQRVLTDRVVPYRAAHFYLSIRGFLHPARIRKRYDGATWGKEEENFIDEIGRAGVNGPFMPGFLSKAGEERVEELHKRFGMRFSYHVSGVSAAAAKKAGAKIIRPHRGIASFDPVYARLKAEAMGEWLKKHGRKPWLFDVRSTDEPFNQVTALLMPGTHEWVNRDSKKLYGVDMGVPPGLPGVPYEDQPISESALRVPDHRTALSRIATFRWMNRKLYEAARLEYEMVRKHGPDRLYQAYNRNAVADMDFLDQALIYDVTDYFCADPYASFCHYTYGTARCRYHVGFTSKLVTDLAAGKPTQMILQGCFMIQRYSTPENVREWSSQAAKAGVTMLDWWGNPRMRFPALYKEMLRLSHLWRKQPALDIPATSDIAVVFSDDARAAAGDEAMQAHYSLHTILGEHLGAWFTFVSENHVRKGLHSLSDAKLIFVPQLAYLSKEFAENLIEKARSGATLVVLDPDVFAHDIESGSLRKQRLALADMPDLQKRSAASMAPTQPGRERFRLKGALPLRPMRGVKNVNNARVLRVPRGALILFVYPDGEPAAFSRRLGKGEVIVFGAMPFQDSELAIQPAGWETLFRSLIDEHGIKRDLPLWRFQFPVKGGEVETHELLIP